MHTSYRRGGGTCTSSALILSQQSLRPRRTLQNAKEHSCPVFAKPGGCALGNAGNHVERSFLHREAIEVHLLLPGGSNYRLTTPHRRESQNKGSGHSDWSLFIFTHKAVYVCIDVGWGFLPRESRKMTERNIGKNDNLENSCVCVCVCCTFCFLVCHSLKKYFHLNYIAEVL